MLRELDLWSTCEVTNNLNSPQAWPSTGNPDRVELGLRQWADAVGRLAPGPDRTFAEALPSTPSGKAMFACIFGASPFLGKCAVRDPAYLRQLWEQGPEECAKEILGSIRAMKPDADKDEIGRELRIARRRMAITIAFADITSSWDLRTVTWALTSLAEEACSAVMRVLITGLARRGALAPPNADDPERKSGLFALGLGKLGGCELNYSSDIDLILLFDPDAVPAAMRYEVPAHFMRLAHSFISVLSEPTMDGIAFRVDLRLRPDPVAMPLVISTKAALNYYEKRGQTWERAALIKARPIAGDREAAKVFLKDLASFVWRERLDFPTVQALHDIKKRIDAQHRGGKIGEPGQDLKLGRGGIREIEFFAQAHQLVWGGADSRFRTIATCLSLRELTTAGRIPAKVTETLILAYEYLRRAEHRIQMVADKQTHSLPTDLDELETLARFLGYPNRRAFGRDLEHHLRQVELQYEDFFELPLEMTEASASSALAGQTRDEAVERLGRLGFNDAEGAFAIVEKWRLGRCAAAREEGALDLLQALTPSIAIAACGTDDPDRALRQIDIFFDSLGDGYNTFALLQANLHVLETVAEILVSAPAVGSMLTARPSLLEQLLDPATDAAPPDLEGLEEDLASRLEGAADDADFLERVRDWADAERCRAAVRTLFRSLSPRDAARHLRNTAECVAEALLLQAETSLAERHGVIPGADVAMLVGPRLRDADATLGVRIDFSLCYDLGKATVSDGSEPLPAQEYFERLESTVSGWLRGTVGQRPIYAHAVSGPTRDVDSLATSLDPTATAPKRVLCMGALADKISALFERPARTPRPEGSLREELATIARERCDESDVAGPWAVECRPGGLLDVESTVQVLRARAGQEHPSVLGAQDTGEVIDALKNAGALEAEDAAELKDAWKLWTGLLTVQHVVGGRMRAGEVPERMRPLVQEAAGADSFDEVGSRLDSAAAAVSRISARVLDS